MNAGSIKILAVIAMICSLYFVGFKSQATSFIDLPFKFYTDSADLIVLGRIKSRTAIADYYEGQAQVCGWLLDIEVKHSFKGVGQNVQIFTRDFEQLFDFEREYFILAFENENYGSKDINGSTFCRHPELFKTINSNHGKLDVSSFKYITETNPNDLYPGDPQFVFALDPYAKEKYGGDWLYTFWGVGANTYVKLIERGENPEHPEGYVAVNFFDLLRETLFADE